MFVHFRLHSNCIWMWYENFKIDTFRMMFSSYKHQRIFYHYFQGKKAPTIANCFRKRSWKQAELGSQCFWESLKRLALLEGDWDREGHLKLQQKSKRSSRIKCVKTMRQLPTSTTGSWSVRATRFQTPGHQGQWMVLYTHKSWTRLNFRSLLMCTLMARDSWLIMTPSTPPE